MPIFPPNIGEMLEDWHSVRFVNQLINRMDISDILASYKSGGAPIYSSKLLLKILFFGYPFFHCLDKLGIALGVRIQVLEIYSFDSSGHIVINDTKDVVISKQIAQNLQVKPSK